MENQWKHRINGKVVVADHNPNLTASFGNINMFSPVVELDRVNADGSYTPYEGGCDEWRNQANRALYTAGRWVVMNAYLKRNGYRSI